MASMSKLVSSPLKTGRGFLVEGTLGIGIVQHPIEVVLDFVDRDSEIVVFLGKKY